MKKFSKKFLIYALVAVISFSSVAVTYQKAKSCKASAVVEGVGFVAFALAILASYGVTISGKYLSNLGDSPDHVVDLGNESLVDYANRLTGKANYDRWCEEQGIYDEESYQEWKKKQPNNNDDDPNNDDPDNFNYDDWKTAFKHATRCASILGVVATVASQLVSDSNNCEEPRSISGIDFPSSPYDDFKYKVCCYPYQSNNPHYFLSDTPLYAYYSDTELKVPVISNLYPELTSMFDNPPNTYQVLPNGTSRPFNKLGFGSSPNLKIFGAIIFNSFDALKTYLSHAYGSLEDYNLSSSLDSDGDGISEPLTQPINDNFQIPDNQTILDFLNNLKDATEKGEDAQPLVDEFVDTVNNPKIDPSPNPDPNPDGGGGGGGSDGGDTDDDNSDPKDLKFDLKKIFPFCIPFDLIAILALLSADRETPYIDIPIKISILKIDEHIIIDFHDYENVGSVSRMLFLFLFCLGLMKMTQRVIKW